MVAERTAVTTIPAVPSAIAQRVGRESLGDILRATSTDETDTELCDCAEVDDDGVEHEGPRP